MTPIPQSLRSLALVLVLSGAVAACGSGSASSSSSASGAGSSSVSSSSAAPAASSTAPAASAKSGPASVSISGYAFHPVAISVSSGTKITFTNHDQTAHTATSTKTGFDSGTLKPGQSATVTVKQAGTYTYFCQFHAFMHGTVVVK